MCYWAEAQVVCDAVALVLAGDSTYRAIKGIQAFMPVGISGFDACSWESLCDIFMRRDMQLIIPVHAMAVPLSGVQQ